MQLNRIIVFFIGVMLSSISHAEQDEPKNLMYTLAKYEKASKECSKYNIIDFKTNNKWFDGLSEDNKKTAIYYIVTTLRSQCLQPLDNELIVAFFYDAAMTNSTEKLLTYLKMVRISMPSMEDERILKERVDKLDVKQLALLKEEIKSGN